MKVQTVSYKDEKAPETLTRSLHETGFAILEDHPISSEQVQSIYKNWGTNWSFNANLSINAWSL